MRFIVARDAFRQLLTKTESAVSRNDERPILRNFLVVATPTRLSVMGADLALGALSHTQIQDAQPGRICLPAKKLSDVAKTAPSGDLMVALDGQQVLIYGQYRTHDESGNPTALNSKMRWELHGVSPELYPEFPSLDPAKAATIRRDSFLAMLNRISFAPPDDPKKPSLGGIWMDGGYAYAADTHVAVRDAVDPHLRGIFLPVDAAKLLAPVLKQSSESEIRVQQIPFYILFGVGSDVYHCRRLEAQFPDVVGKVVRPTDGFESCLAVRRKNLRDAIKRARVTIDDKYWLTLRYSRGKFFVSTRDNLANAFVEVVDGAEWQGADFERHANLQYLNEVIDACEGDVIQIRLGDGSSAIQNAIRIEDGSMTAVLLPLTVG